MIALIAFEKDQVMERSKADELGLQYDWPHSKRIGFSLYHEAYATVYSDDCYTTDLEERDGKWYKPDSDKALSTLDVFRPMPEGEFVIISKEGHMVDLVPFASKNPPRFYIVKAIQSQEPSVNNIQSLLYEVEQKTQVIDKTLSIMEQHTFNQKVNVHVGGGLIVTYNDLMLKENACTDELQVELNNGWRIIAVCVQPDHRRPDYILGRYNPKLDTNYKVQADR